MCKKFVISFSSMLELIEIKAGQCNREVQSAKYSIVSK